MRYLVTAKVKAGQSDALARAIEDETLGRGSVAGDEYLRNMEAARQLDDGRVQWVEVCYCPTPLAEEREPGHERLEVRAELEVVEQAIDERAHAGFPDDVDIDPTRVAFGLAQRLDHVLLHTVALDRPDASERLQQEVALEVVGGAGHRAQ